MAARKTEEGHSGHAGGSENHAKDVEVHLFRVYLSSGEDRFRHGDVVRVTTSPQSTGELAHQN
jgi:hypothetical protein